jgi:ATP-binding cassette, subfamily B, bacterial
MSLKNEPIVFLTEKLWRYSEGNRKNVVIYVSLFFFANIFSFLQPLVVANLLNTIQEEGVGPHNIWKLAFITGLIVILNVFFWLLHGPARVIERKNSFYVMANYKKYLVDGVLSLPAEWHVNHHSGNTIDKIEKGSSRLFQFSGTTYEIIETVIKFVSSTIALIYFNLSSGFVILFGMIIAGSIVIKYDKTIREQLREIFKAENATSQKIFDTISNITTVIILRIEKLASNEIFKKIMSPFQTFSKLVKINELKWATVSILTTLMTFFVLLTYFMKSIYFHETVLVGTVYVLYGYIDRINGVLFRFAGRYSEIMQQKTAVENAEELSKDFIKKRKIKKIDMKKGWKILKVKKLTFSYKIPEDFYIGEKEKEELHLKDIRLNIKKGEKIALIGESGSGKTTFLKLIRGLYTTNELNLYLDDQKINSFNDIEENITLIPQDPEIFTTTIKENVTMGIKVNKDEIKKYTNLACVTEVIERLPNKLKSSIKEKGVNLSGGEKQRLALARGLLACKDKEIILLDEPTSSVDSKNELKIYENIFQEFRNKTVISTIHRLHLLPFFDTIYFFERGRIVASGSFDDLMKNKAFLKMWKKYSIKPDR